MTTNTLRLKIAALQAQLATLSDELYAREKADWDAIHAGLREQDLPSSDPLIQAVCGALARRRILASVATKK